MRQRAAVGVAQDQPARTVVVGGLQAIDGEGAVGLVAVEEMLGVEHHLVLALAGEPDAVADHADGLVQLDAQRDLGVEVPGLAHHADGADLGLEDGDQAGVVVGAAPRAPRHAENREPRPLERGRIAEKLVVGRIRPRPSTFDVVDPQAVELARDRLLVGDAEVDPLCLRAIAQRAVVKVDPLTAHISRFPGKALQNAVFAPLLQVSRWRDFPHVRIKVYA